MHGLAAAARPEGAFRVQTLSWERDGFDWPHREASRFVRAGGLRWHVQVLGQGPPLLLLHGAGGATHSWRGLAPILARRFEVIAPDLPGHGFSGTHRDARTLPGMTRAVGALLRALGRRPVLVVGHSAGAAIACRLGLDSRLAIRGLVGLNAALLPWPGLAGRIVPRVGALWTGIPLVPAWLAWRARDPRRVSALMRGTGSRLDAEGLRLYGRLVGNPGHVAGTLGMMASLDLRPLRRDLPRLRPRLLLVVGDRDRYIAPSQADEIAALVPETRVVHCAGLGHLAHEEEPRRVGGAVLRFARSLGLAGGA